MGEAKAAHWIMRLPVPDLTGTHHEMWTVGNFENIDRKRVHT
jgi:hypothetical protein